MTTNEVKVMCSEIGCAWHGMEADILSAPHPFIAGEIIYACPECKEIGVVMSACDVSDCWNEATCGAPTKCKYRTLCSTHYYIVGTQEGAPW